MARTAASSKILTDHDEIRRWAEDRGANPACVRGTGGSADIGMIRLDFPGYSGEGKLEQISWGDWFDKFDESGLALLVQEKTARGQTSNFNKLVNRKNAESGESRSSSRSTRARRGKRASSTGTRNRTRHGRATARNAGSRSKQRTTARAGKRGSQRSTSRSSSGQGASRGRSSRKTAGKKSAGRVAASSKVRRGSTRKRAA